MSCISHGPDRIQMKEKIIDNFVVNCHICRKKTLYEETSSVIYKPTTSRVLVCNKCLNNLEKNSDYRKIKNGRK